MTTSAPTEQAAARSLLLQKWRAAYYAGTPIISDAEYDYHEKKQQEEWPEDPVLHSVGGVLESPFAQVVDGEAMLSLRKIYDPQELKKFIAGKAIVVESKIDGMSLELRYRKGFLTQAVSRGRNGALGFDITANAMFVKGIPHYIQDFTGEIRGEVIQTFEAFERYTQDCLTRKENKPKHPRNVATGAMQQKDPTFVQKRYLSFIGYYIVGQEDLFPTEVDVLTFLKEKGFTLPRTKFYKVAEVFTSKIDAQLKTWQEELKKLSYPCDGIVIQYNDRKYRKTLGVSTSHPHGARAFKWEEETADTEVVDITWSVGRTGELTPVAVVEPVELSGAVISNVTVHHLGYVEANNIKPGSVIKIIRSGEIIPKHLETLSYNKEKPFGIPTECPSCKSSLVKEQGLKDNTVTLCCTNPLCPAQQFEKIHHYVKVAEIDHIGSGILEAMFKQGFVKTIPDLYLLLGKPIENMQINGKTLGCSRGKKIKLAIEKASVLTLPRFLAALGIRGVGLGIAEKICQSYSTLTEIEQLTVEKLSKVEGFGCLRPHIVFDGLTKALPLINYLKPFIKLKTIEDESLVLTSVLAGLSFVVTGSFSEENPRKEIEKMITVAGGKLQSSPTKFTNFLIQGSGGGSKAQKAAKLNITVLDEQGFFELIANRSQQIEERDEDA